MARFTLLVALLLPGVSAQAEDYESEPELLDAPQPQPKPKPQAQARPEPQLQAQARPEPQLQVQARPEPQLQAQPEPALKPEPEVVPEGREIAEPGWIPSIDVGFEFFDYGTESTILNLVSDAPPSGSGSETYSQLMVRIGAELMGPMFEDLPGRPRLFAQGGVGIRTFSSDTLLEVGNPHNPDQPGLDVEGYYCPDGEGGRDLENPCPRRDNHGPLNRNLPSDFLGQASALDAQLEDPSWYAGLGIAFSVPIAPELLLYVKPSFQYSVETIDFTGSLTTVIEQGTSSADDPLPRCRPRATCLDGPWIRDFSILRGNSDSSTTDHRIGPGLEVALAFRSVRPIRISLFGQVRFLWLVSSATTEFADGIAAYSVERDDFDIRGGAGLRFSWVGFD